MNILIGFVVAFILLILILRFPKFMITLIVLCAISYNFPTVTTYVNNMVNFSSDEKIPVTAPVPVPTNPDTNFSLTQWFIEHTPKK